MAVVKGPGGAAAVEIAARWRGGVGWMAGVNVKPFGVAADRVGGVKGRAVGDGEEDLPPVGAIRSGRAGRSERVTVTSLRVIGNPATTILPAQR